MSVTLRGNLLKIKDPVTGEYYEVSSYAAPGEVADWLDDHPEATTSIQDGSITPEKLANSTKTYIQNIADSYTAEMIETSVATETAAQVAQMQVHEGQVVVDGTLTVSGAAADAKVVGDNITELKSDFVSLYAGGVPTQYIELPSMYIAPNNGHITRSSSETFATCLIVVPIVGGTSYTVKKDTATIMRLATGTVQSPSTGYAPSAYVMHESASSDLLSITADDDDLYMYIQLFATSDSAALRSISANLPTLRVYDSVNLRITQNANNIQDLDTELTTVGEKLGIERPTLSLTSGYYINKTGGLSSGNYSYSAPVAVSAGDKIVIDCVSRSANVAIISTCNQDFTNIALQVLGVSSEATEYNEFAYIVNADGYVCFSFFTRGGYDLTIYKKYSSDVYDSAIPSYWNGEISASALSVNTNRLAIGNRIAEFFFLTDIHWDGNAKQSPAIINAMSKSLGISNVLMGGDIVYTHNDTQMDAVEQIESFYERFLPSLRMFSTIGNHDRNNNNNPDTSLHLSPEQLYTLMMQREELYTDTGASPYVTIYDNDSQKIRFIQFYHPDVIAIPVDAQNAVKAAVTEKGSDWTVIIMTHVYWASNAVDQYISAFAQELATLNTDTSHAVIAALIVGHCHEDTSIVVNDNLLVIASQCDIYRQTLGADMTLGTDTEQSFEIYQIDPVNRKIYITKVGSGLDREFTY